MNGRENLKLHPAQQHEANTTASYRTAVFFFPKETEHNAEK